MTTSRNVQLDMKIPVGPVEASGGVRRFAACELSSYSASATFGDTVPVGLML